MVNDPFIGKKLKGATNRFSLRLMYRYRLVYSVYKAQALVDFEYAGHRKNAYPR